MENVGIMKKLKIKWKLWYIGYTNFFAKPTSKLRALEGHHSDQSFAGLHYLEGQGDLVSRLARGIIRVTIWVIEVINLLARSS